MTVLDPLIDVAPADASRPRPDPMVGEFTGPDSAAIVDVVSAERASLVLQRRTNRTSQRARRAQATVDQTIADITQAAEARVGAEEKRAGLAEERATPKKRS